MPYKQVRKQAANNKEHRKVNTKGRSRDHVNERRPQTLYTSIIRERVKGLKVNSLPRDCFQTWFLHTNCKLLHILYNEFTPVEVSS